MTFFLSYRAPVQSVIPTKVARQPRGAYLQIFMEKGISVQYYVYILTNKSNRVLYIGVTNNLVRRIFEHKEKMVDGFTARYNIDKLVYYEVTNDVKVAIEREKQLKKWARSKKDWLIQQQNPLWKDLSLNF